MIDLKELRSLIKGSVDSNNWNRILITNSDLKELLDMLEAAQKDAARYQLIRKSGLPEDAFGDCDSYYGVYKSQVGEVLDETIDAAMAATEGEQA